jgi:CBS domain containing-hemolysin-like protein
VVGRRPLPPRAALAALLLLAAGGASASMFKGEALDKVADWLAIFVLIFVPIGGVALFWLVHILPEKIAEKRHHPQKDAITTLCLLSLVFGGMLWPIAWLWAYTRPVGYRLAYGTDKHENYFIEKAHAARAGKLPEDEARRLKAELDDIASRKLLSLELRAAREELEAALAQAAQPGTKAA